MAAGTPVIMTRDCGFAHIITPFQGDNQQQSHAWVIEPRSIPSVVEALTSALSRPDLRSALALAGQSFVRQHLTWRSNAQRVADMLFSPTERQ
jgi:glycosyltransferase involved in cell wall biosynthesis